MAEEGKIRSLCRVLLLAASIGALSAGAAVAQDASADLSDLNTQILNDPGNATLNLRYAHAAEAAGKPRLALAAYERILINDPTNEEARAGYERVRRVIEPGFTVARAEIGAATDSNPINIRHGYGDENSSIYFGRFEVANESQLAGMRWRSNLNAEADSYSEIEELNYQYLGAQTGPVISLAPHLALQPAIGVSRSWLGGEGYFKEISASLGIEGRSGDISYWARTRYGQRDYDHRDVNFIFITPVTESGHYIELRGGAAKPHLLNDRDSLVVSPFARWSDIEGSVFDFYLFGDYSPGKYHEYGLDAAYNYQLTDHLQASIGALWRTRDFQGVDRDDTYLSPRASLTWQSIFSSNCDLKVEYSQRDNNSDDFLANYQAERTSLSLIARF